MITNLTIKLIIIGVIGMGAAFFSRHRGLTPPVLQEAMATRATIYELRGEPNKWNNTLVRVVGVVAPGDRYSILAHGVFWLHDPVTGLRIAVWSRDGAPTVNTPIEVVGTYKHSLEIGALTAGVIVQD